jgi:hypothetical protein
MTDLVGGRHADPDRGAFWRSLAAAALKALLVLALVAAVTSLVVLYAGPGDADGRLAGAAPAPALTGGT